MKGWNRRRDWTSLPALSLSLRVFSVVGSGRRITATEEAGGKLHHYVNFYNRNDSIKNMSKEKKKKLQNSGPNLL